MSLEELSFRELQSLCKSKALLATGKRSELVERLVSNSKLQLIDSENVDKCLTLTNFVLGAAHSCTETTEKSENPKSREALGGISKLELRTLRFGTQVKSNLSVHASLGNCESEAQKLLRRAARFGISPAI